MGNVARVFMVNQEMAVLDSQSAHFWPRLGLQQMEIYLFIHFCQIIYHWYFFFYYFQYFWTTKMFSKTFFYVIQNFQFLILRFLILFFFFF